MNTRIIILFFVFLVQSCILVENSDNDLSNRNIKGDVISLEVVSYNAIEKFGEITKGEAGWQNNQDKDSYTIFNKNGNIIQWYSYNSRGYLENKYIYEYDEKGNYIERNSYISNGRLDSKKIYKYNDKGKIEECNNYNYNGVLDYSEKYKYDNNDKIIEENWYTSDGKLGYKISYTYNDNGKKIKTIIYDSNGIIQTSQTNDYNKKGDLIVHNIYNSEGSIKTENKYNYNDKGDIVEEYTFDYIEGTEQKLINKYEYDSKGNWVSCIIYINNEPKYIIQRIIGYDVIKEKELINEMTLKTIVGIYTKVKENERGHSLNVFGRGLVSEIDFKEKYCTFLYFGNPMTAEFELLENFVYVKVGGELGVLKFEITTENTLEGEGWASGTFKKDYSSNE
ncbi:MAG: hypothetical protein RBR97_19395 [Bacteroidales bacterium]|nr:hypothetical protein [Bacteroidales bacterium]